MKIQKYKMKYLQVIFYIPLILNSCIVENPINGNKLIRFEVLSLPDSISVDSVECQLVKCHTIAFQTVASAYTDTNGYCSLEYNFEYEKYLYYKAELKFSENGLISNIHEGQQRFYELVDHNTKIVDLARKNEFNIKIVLFPLRTLILVFDKSGIDSDRIKIDIYDNNIISSSHTILGTDSMNFYFKDNNTHKFVCTLTKNNLVVSTQIDSCKFTDFNTQRKEIVFK